MFKLIIFLAFFSTIYAHAYDPSLFINNKETESKALKSQHYAMANRWAGAYGDRSFALTQAKALFAYGLLELKKRDTSCDLGMVDLLIKQGLETKALAYERDLIAVFALLRIENQIDDLLFSNILNSYELRGKLGSMNDGSYPRLGGVTRSYNDLEAIDLKATYKEFATWPDDVKKCSLTAYHRMAMTLTWKDEKDRDRVLKNLNYMALRKNVITPQVFNNLETFRKEESLNWPVHLPDYIDIVLNAKDKLSPLGKPVNDPATFSTKHKDRKNKLTFRERIYKNFSSTQVMILSGIIEKTAKRIDARNVSIVFRYNNDTDISETYVLSPMEKYRLSLKMLRKDMADVMRSETFAGRTVEYEDIVAAAYETGYIKSEELEMILKFEDFWNPKTPKWKTYANFAFSLAGTTTWFLPPPWNIVGALALVIGQTKIMKTDVDPDADDNWNVVI